LLLLLLLLLGSVDVDDLARVRWGHLAGGFRPFLGDDHKIAYFSLSNISVYEHATEECGEHHCCNRKVAH
jgi:hypothetical protein